MSIPMVKALAPTVKAYVNGCARSSAVPRQRCPVCGALCWRHGRYQRWAVEQREQRRIVVFRQRCPRCRKTFGVLPAFVRPWTSVVTLVREAAVRSRYDRGRPLAAVARQFSGVTSARTVQRWLVQARQRAPAVLAPLSEAILALFAGVDPTALLPMATTEAASVVGLLRLGVFYRRLSWARGVDRGVWTAGLFALCNSLGWAPRAL